MWPLLTSFAVLTMAVGAVMYFHGFVNGGNLLTLGFLLTLFGMILWFRDVISEGSLNI
jgi:cytochrome c oxidase subunit 3